MPDDANTNDANTNDANTGDADEQRREELIAYLDGELSADRVAAVEEQLSSDAEVRTDLQQLSAVWDCLDELPRTTVDEKFASSTVEMVALSAERDLHARRAGAPRRWLLLASACGVLTLAGYALAALVWPSADDQLLVDLPVVANLDLYQQVEDVDFLRRLANEVTWNEDPPIGMPAFYFETGSRTESGTEGAATGRQWIEVLADDAKAALRNQRDRFARLPQDEQRRLRDLHASIMREPNAEQLLATLGLYQDWLQELSPGQRDDLRNLPADERLASIQTSLGDDRRRDQWRQRIRTELQEIDDEISPRDQRTIVKWTGDYLRKHRHEIMRDLPEERRRQMHRQIQVRGGGGPGRDIGMWRVISDPRRTGNVSFLQAEQLRQLASRLSDGAQQRLGEAASPDERERTIRRWVQQSMRAAMMRRQLDPRRNTVREQDLEEYFAEELSSTERERLLALPRDEMRTELRRLYLRDVLGVNMGRGAGRTPHDRPGRRGRPGTVQDGRSPSGPPHGGARQGDPGRGDPGRGGPERRGPRPRDREPRPPQF